jgi:hypothetical protein
MDLALSKHRAVIRCGATFTGNMATAEAGFVPGLGALQSHTGNVISIEIL